MSIGSAAGAHRSVEAALYPNAELPPGERLRRVRLPERHRAEAGLGVLDITKWFGETTGGVKTYLLEKARYVEARPWLRHILVVPGAHDSIATGDGVRRYRLRSPLIPTQHPYRLLFSTDSVRRIVTHERPDVIEVGSPFLVPWITRRATRGLDVPLVMFFHGNFPRTICPFPERAGPMRRRVDAGVWRYVRRLTREFRVTIVASDFMASDLERHAAAATPVVKVPLGVDLDHFHPRRRADATRTRIGLGLPTDAPIAAFLGRFAREKEVDLLVRGWETIAAGTDAHLVLVGDGPARRRLQAQSRGPRISWLPYQSDREQLANLLAAIDLLISPGSIETFGLSALEAAASGTPVLSADRGGVAEQIRCSGGGALFTAGDAAALADAARALLRASHDLPRLGALARQYAEREHSWSGVFDRIVDVYRRVIA